MMSVVRTNHRWLPHSWARIVAALWCTVASFASAPQALAYTLTMYGPSAYDTNVATMNSNLGISNALYFEDFDDSSLIPQLSVTVNDPGGPVPTSATPGSTTFPNAAWTGTASLLFDGDGLAGQSITFTIAGGTTRFAVGIGEDDYGGGGVYINSPIVNGSPTIAGLTYTSIGGYQVGALLRNGYLIIDADPGDALLTSLTFTSGGPQHLLTFDHVAIGEASTPEPSSLALLFAAIGGFALRRRRVGLGGAAR